MLALASHAREARKAIAQAAQPAQCLPLPEQQKLLIQAGQLAAEGRLDEEIQVLQAAVGQFPKEVELRFALGRALSLVRPRESAAALEETVRLDPKQAAAYNSLGYAYARQGDLPRALAALDKYAALRPPNDPNPIHTRGDVYALNGQFDNAIAQYKKNAEPHPDFSFPGWSQVKLALAYLSEGKNPLAETLARSDYNKDQRAQPRLRRKRSRRYRRRPRCLRSRDRSLRRSSQTLLNRKP